MGRKRYNWLIVLHLVGALLAWPLSINALADGFSDKLVQIDGINSQGTLNDQKDLEFLGLGLWNGPVKLLFSPSVLTRYTLGATVETETGEIMGKYAVKFKLIPKNGKVNNQNLKITVKDRWGNELEGEVMLTGEDGGLAIEVATKKKPQQFRISYSPSP
jgi:hypothetical protein